MTDKTVKCPIHKLEFPIETCISRQEIVQNKPDGGVKLQAYRIFKKSCGRCEIGKKLHQESRGEKMAEIRKCAGECGKPLPETSEYFRPAGRGLSKVCRECEEAAVRKDIKGSAPEPAATAAKSAIAEPTDTGKEKPEAEPAEVHAPDPMTKPCALEGCDRMCVQRPGESPGSFANRKFCSEKCSQKARSLRKRKVREMARGIAEFDQGKAEEIARESTEKVLRLAAVFVNDPRALEQMRGVAFEVGVECQRRMVGAA